MLPKNLVVAERGAGRIKPKFLVDTFLAEVMISLFKLGKKLREIDEERTGLETHDNFKTLRGLFHILVRRFSKWEEASFPAKELRDFLFSKGYVTDAAERRKILEDTEKIFRIPVREIEEKMWSDRAEEKKLEEFNPPEPEELIKIYNLSLAQSILFDAVKLDVKLRGNVRNFLRKLKFLKLMWDAREDGTVVIFGPLSAIKETTRYGTSFAKILPEVLKAESFWLKAEIEGGYVFKLSYDDRKLFPETEEEIAFDSSTEEDFFFTLKGALKGTRWSVLREPDIVKVGDSIFLPDFCVETNSIGKEVKHYIEIVGFWTPDYLLKKEKKIKDAGIDITVLVDEDFGDGAFKNVDIITFRRKLPIDRVLEKLRKLEDKLMEVEIKTANFTVKEFERISTIAEKLGVGREVIILRARELGYKIAQDFVLSEEFVKKLEDELESGIEIQKARKILSKYGLPVEVVEALGFKIVWESLLPPKAKIVK